MSKKKKTRIRDQARTAQRTKHYSIRIEESHINWIKKFLLFNRKQHPSQQRESAYKINIKIIPKGDPKKVLKNVNIN